MCVMNPIYHVYLLFIKQHFNTIASIRDCSAMLITPLVMANRQVFHCHYSLRVRAVKQKKANCKEREE